MTNLPDQVFYHLHKTAQKISPNLAHEFKRIGPIAIKPPRYRTVAGHLYPSIVGQQLSTRAAQTIWSRIEQTARTNKIAVQDLFTDNHLTALRDCGVSGRKARALLAVRQADANGLHKKKNLARLSHSERSARLCSIWGVGQWTADMIGIFHFLDPDIWPNGDAAATATLQKWTNCQDPEQMAQAFAPYRSILARYMWRSKDVPTL